MNKKGFTLIEVLIVVVIVGILAALVVPRFLSQPEKAVIAEATQMLGALKRAQIQKMDMTMQSSWLAIDNATNETAMNNIGMKAIPDSKFFTYACTTGNNCTATRKNATNDKITITLDSPSLNCQGNYTNDTTTGGCTRK